MAMPSLYPTYKEFMLNFCRKGGIIEGMPNCLQSSQRSSAIFFLIEPSGAMQLLGSYDKIAAKEFVNIAAIFPQTSLPGINLEAVIKTIGFLFLVVYYFLTTTTKKKKKKKKRKRTIQKKNLRLHYNRFSLLPRPNRQKRTPFILGSRN